MTLATFQYGPALHTKYNIYDVWSFYNTQWLHLLKSATELPPDAT